MAPSMFILLFSCWSTAVKIGWWLVMHILSFRQAKFLVSYILAYHFHFRVLGVANIKQSPNASFSYEGVLFNGNKIEIQLLNSVSTSYIMYRHLKTQDFISLHFGVWDGSSGTQQEVYKLNILKNKN